MSVPYPFWPESIGCNSSGGVGRWGLSRGSLAASCLCWEYPTPAQRAAHVRGCAPNWRGRPLPGRAVGFRGPSGRNVSLLGQRNAWPSSLTSCLVCQWACQGPSGPGRVLQAVLWDGTQQSFWVENLGHCWRERGKSRSSVLDLQNTASQHRQVKVLWGKVM